MRTLNCANGDRLPALGLGTWKSDPGEVYQAVREAIRIGYRHIDCAAIYGNEKEIGQALADAMRASEVQRSELWITSKLWNDSHKKEQVRPALVNTLADLQLDYLDLYLIHWPVAFRNGVSFPHSRDDFLTLDEVPLTETWSGMEACVDEHLVRHIGTSNCSARKLQLLLEAGRIRPSVDQVEMHPLLQQGKLKRYCDREHVVLTAYSPLGSRDRNPAFRAKDEPDMLEIEVIRKLAAAHAATPAQILLAWAVNRGTSVIPKSVNPQRLQLNFDAAAIELNSTEMNLIDGLDRHYRYVTGSFFAGKNSPYTIGGIWDE
ncbi:MAG: aldo/keto reductase [Gammaproteobacteria bacterium]|nr:aldo/keto reductase [Pseudomonadales bacterium]MCP5349071.1 aldo/keto reductase [Pseudomonadales bacterium]